MEMRIFVELTFLASTGVFILSLLFADEGSRAQSRYVDLSAAAARRAFVFKIISHVRVSKFAGHDLAARGEFMRKSGVGVMPEPLEVNYSTSGRTGGRQLPPKERTIVADENHPADSGRFDNGSRERNSTTIPRGDGRDEKLASRRRRVVVGADALGQFANQDAKRYDCNCRELSGISGDDDATDKRRKNDASARFQRFPR